MEILVVVIFLSLTGAQKSQLEGPQNTLSVVGSTVTLKCSQPSRNCNGIDWQKNIPYASPTTVFKGPGTFLNTVDRDRYSVDNSSGCDLVIRNVKLIDAGRFVCSAISSASQISKTAYLIILETQPKCTLNVSLHDTVEGDGVQLNCALSHNGTCGASMNWKDVGNAPAAVKNGKTLSRSYYVVASNPEVPSFTCETSFALETNDVDGKPIGGLATNKISVTTCKTPAINVLSSVRNVTLLPSLSNYPSGTIITCSAKGYPSPTIRWQEMENSGTWVDIQKRNESEFTLAGVSSKRYRCVATNIVRNRNHNAVSNEIQFSNTVADRLGIGLGIGFGIGLLVAILLATVVIAILVKLRCLYVHPRPAKKSPDGADRHQDHEMSPSSHQRSDIGRSTANKATPLVVEQESAYASLGEDRDANEYTSLDKRPKVKPKKKSRP